MLGPIQRSLAAVLSCGMAISDNKPDSGCAYFPGRDGGRYYERPVETVEARRVEEVVPALTRIAEAVDGGLHAAGYLAYEAAPAFDPALRAHPPGEEPLLSFGLYDGPVAAPDSEPGDYNTGDWRARTDEPAYASALAAIRRHIEAGDTYQVNYTFPLEASFSGDSRAYFEALYAAQGGGYPAYIDTGRYQVLSASPELFFELDGGRLRCKPMKGTRPRGLWTEADQANADALRDSEKDQAENIMIVDMVRNDLGRIAKPGGVEVTQLFDVTRFETVWQMTSTVEATTEASVPEIIAALFPCASVTGAPKIETMKIIRELEPQARGVYCGAVGWWAPGGKACFNVPIRTVLVDPDARTARYHVGSGVTWDSVAALEYQECLDKAALLRYKRPEMALLETLLWEDGRFFLLEEHLVRLQSSAAYFSYTCDLDKVRAALAAYVGDSAENRVTRLTLDRQGALEITERPVPEATAEPLRVALATAPVSARDVLLYHKTTARQVYDDARAERPDCDDVLLWNERGELTETTFANIVLQIDGKLLTPARASGLLGGAFRAHLLARGEIEEAVLRKEDLAEAKTVYLINSVRKWRKTVLVPD